MSAISPAATTAHHTWFDRLQLRRFSRTMLFDIMVLLACILPGIILSQQQLQEPWNAFRLARAQLSINQGAIADYTTSAGAYRAEHLGSDLLHTALINATGWPLDGLVVLPIGAFLLALAYYGIAIMLSPSRRWAAGITLFCSWYYPGIYSQFGTQTYVWVYSLLLGFLILFFQWLHHPKRSYELILTAIFLATFLHYHTTPLWMIGLMTIGVAGSKWAQRTTGAPYRYSWLLPLSWLVWDIVFESVLRNGWQHLQAINPNTIGQSFLSKVFGPLLQRTPAGLDPFEIAPVNPPLATWSTFLCLLILTIPVAWWMLRQITTARTTRNLHTLVATPHHIFVWAVIGIAIAHTSMYLLYGALSVRVIPVLFPVLIPIIWRDAPWKSWSMGLLVLLVGSAMVGFFSFAPTIQPDLTTAQTGRASRLLATKSTMLSDANLYGSFALQRAIDNQTVNLAWIDAPTYHAMVDGQPLPATIDAIAIAKTTKPLITTQWQYFAAWLLSNPVIERHPAMNQVYASSVLSLLQPTDHALPMTVPPDLPTTPASWFIPVLRLLGTMLGLFLIPGLAIFWVAQRKQIFGIDLDIRVILACTIALSVLNLTVMGYVMHLSGMRINGMIVLTMILPLASLMVLWLRGQRVTIAPRWWRYGISIVIVLGCWLGFATHGVRAQATLMPALEVVATQATIGSLTIEVANNTDMPTTATVVIETPEGMVMMTTKQALPAHRVTAVPWMIPTTAAHQPAVIRVITDQQSPLTLWFAQIPTGK